MTVIDSSLGSMISPTMGICGSYLLIFACEYIACQESRKGPQKMGGEEALQREESVKMGFDSNCNGE